MAGSLDEEPPGRRMISSRNSDFGKFNRGTLAAIPLGTVEFKREDLGGLW
jgi:hypothetical protein